MKNIWSTIKSIEAQLKQLEEKVEHLEDAYYIEKAKNGKFYNEEEVNKIFEKAGLPPLGVDNE